MEPHPIPQNVTSFQFKLVGDMTLKQFIYLAIGSSVAYAILVFFSARYPIVSWPLIIISALLGISFAFLPLGARPLDYWVKAYLKAVYSPTKRVWRKNNKNYQDEPLFTSRYVTYISGLQPTVPADTIITTPVIQPPPIVRPAPPPNPPDLPTEEELGKTVELAREAQNLQMKIIQTERALNQIRTEAQKPTPIPIDYSQQVNKIFSDLQTLMTQASQIKQQLELVGQPQIEQVAPIPQPMIKPKVKVVIPTKLKTSVALTTFPNVINGIIKDLTANYLAGVVVVIYDKEGLPVRALKTNKLGQFTGSTPLSNGTYTIELEKDDFTFDVLEVELTGQVMPPLIIMAK